MIDDIVVLPRTLTQFKREAEVSSEMMSTLPISYITKEVGYESPNDDDWIRFGGSVSVATGKNTWFRFKLIEGTPNGLVEYFCLSESPIDFYNPRNSKKLKFYCPWLSITDLKTFKTTKYVLWRHIFELTHYEVEDNVVDTPAEAVIANEVKNFAYMYGCDHFLKEVEYYPSDYKNVLISQIRPNNDNVALDNLTRLLSNIRAFNSDINLVPFGAIVPEDIWRGVNIPHVWTDLGALRNCSVLPFLQFGSITISEIAHLFSPLYQLHAYQRSFSKAQLDQCTVLSIPSSDTRQLFDIIKYMEELPYSEFELRVDREGCRLKVYNPYNLNPINGNMPLADVASDSAPTDAIRTLFYNGFRGMAEAFATRSWSEEIYITVMNTNGSVEYFYYDLSVTATCARSLIRDYDGQLCKYF